MILMSIRRHFSDPHELQVGGHLAADVDLAGQRPMIAMTMTQVLDELRDRRLLLLVHGYNNDQHKVYGAYADIEAMVQGTGLGDHYDAVVGYLWPGENWATDWYPAVENAGFVTPQFGELLQALSGAAASVDVMSHSLGARVVLGGLMWIPSGTRAIRNCYTTAAAVDNEVLEPEGEFHGCHSRCGRLFVMHSVRDPVLLAAYPLAEWDLPLGLKGPESRAWVLQNLSNVFVLNCQKRVRKHGTYKRCPELFDYIHEHLTTDPPRLDSI